MRQILSRIILRRSQKQTRKKFHRHSRLDDHFLFVNFVSKDCAKLVNYIVTLIVQKYGQTYHTF